MKKKTVLKFGIILLSSLVIIGLGLVITWNIILTQGYPQVNGVMELNGLQEPVEILRDKNGIPHIYAKTLEDMFFAQGYVHAQDRFWQMEYWRRIGSGTLSELFGEKTLNTDIYLRTVGFKRVAEKEYEQMDEQTKMMLDSYAADVNAYILERPAEKLGLEFFFLKLQVFRLQLII